MYIIYVCVYLCLCMYLCINQTPFSLFPWSRWALNSECKIDLADFTD